MPVHDLVFVDDTAGVPSALARIADLDPVGIDVERADSNRYWRAAALVQLGGAGRVVVLDPLAIEDFGPLQDFFEDRKAVLHAFENDVVPLAALGVTLPRIADTAVAAALIGLPTGLEGLLRDVLGVPASADKAAMQRAAWEQRPLSQAMLDYAGGDVADLPQLWAALVERLEGLGRWAWYAEEIAAVRAQPPVEERRDWRRTRGIGRLDQQARGRVRALWSSRERLAQDTDTAPGRIVSDRVLIDLATTPPRRATELGRRGMRRQAVRTFGSDLLAAIAEADSQEPEPRPLRSRRPTDADRAHAEALRGARGEIAAEHGVDPGVLCPSRVLLGAVLADPVTCNQLRAAMDVRDWQWALLRDRFCAVLGLDGGGGDPS